MTRTSRVRPPFLQQNLGLTRRTSDPASVAAQPAAAAAKPTVTKPTVAKPTVAVSTVAVAAGAFSTKPFTAIALSTVAVPAPATALSTAASDRRARTAASCFVKSAAGICVTLWSELLCRFEAARHRPKSASVEHLMDAKYVGLTMR